MSNSVFDILRRPVVTEKSHYQASKLHQYVFEVAKDATRETVKTENPVTRLMSRIVERATPSSRRANLNV